MSRAEDVWIYDQLNPDERKMRGYKKQRHAPAWAEQFPEHLIGRGDERTDEEKEKAQDEYLKKNGL